MTNGTNGDTNGKPWYKSKTKWGGICVGGAGVIASIGGLLQGSLTMEPTIISIIANLGIILAVFGIRDLPVFNK